MRRWPSPDASTNATDNGVQMLPDPHAHVLQHHDVVLGRLADVEDRHDVIEKRIGGGGGRSGRLARRGVDGECAEPGRRNLPIDHCRWADVGARAQRREELPAHPKERRRAVRRAPETRQLRGRVREPSPAPGGLRTQQPGA